MGAWSSGAAGSRLLILAAIEPMVAPIQFRSFAGVSRIYEALATEPHAVVVELPMPGGFGWFGNARYMVHSTRHWRPMLNGYSGFAPASFHEHTRALATFPQPEAIAALETIGVTHAFVQIDGYTAEQHAFDGIIAPAQPGGVERTDSAVSSERDRGSGSMITAGGPPS